jgi:polysaccharide pyruvyl transferase WcaK-like protein
MGIGALASGAIKCILNAYPHAELSLLDYSKKTLTHTLKFNGGTVDVRLIGIRFSKKFYLSNNIALLLFVALTLKLVPWKKMREKLAATNFWLRHISETDLVASIAGGDSFSDIYGLGRLLYVSLPQILVLLLDKRLILLPQTIGPFRTRFSRGIARYILKRAQRVYSRDQQGLRRVQSLLGSAHATDKTAFCYDVGFVLEPKAPDHAEIAGLSIRSGGNRPVIGLNVSGLLYMGGYTRKNMFGLRANYGEVMDKLIDFLIVQENADVLLIPHVFGTDPESDDRVCERIYEMLCDRYKGRLGLLQGRYDQHEVKYLVGKCDFFVGSRMHACIAAVSQGVPAVCIAYSDKFIGVMETLGIQSLVVDARQLGIIEILEAIGQAYAERVIVRQKLESKMPEVCQTVLNLFTSINGRNVEQGGQDF